MQQLVLRSALEPTPAAVRALFIDGSGSLLPEMAIYLTSLGCEVTVVPGVAGGMRTASEIFPDVIVIGLALPGEDALDAIRLVHRDHLLSAVPIIAVGTNASTCENERCIEAGATVYAEQSVPMDALAVIILAYARRFP